MAGTIRDLPGSKSRIVRRKLPKDDPKVRQPDISLAKRVLRWSPRIGLDQGLKKTIRYFRTRLGKRHR